MALAELVKADEGASRTEAAAALAAAADRLETTLRDAFLEAVEGLRDEADVRAIAGLLERGDIDGAARHMLRALEGEPFADFGERLLRAVETGGTVAAEVAPPLRTPTGTRLNVRFDVLNPETARFLREYRFNRIRQLDSQVREVVANVIRDGVTRGDNPLTVARRLRDSLGLTARQEQAVTNYRRALEDLDTDALARELRDRRFDPTVARAIRDGNRLSPAQVDRMTSRYRERYLKHRAETVARTEATRAVNAGQHQLWEQQVTEGKVRGDQLRRFWVYTRDGRTRAAHVAIPGMNENGVGLEEPFRTPLGPLLYPGDPAGTAANTANCRCTVFTRIVPDELLEDL